MARVLLPAKSSHEATTLNQNYAWVLNGAGRCSGKRKNDEIIFNRNRRKTSSAGYSLLLVVRLYARRALLRVLR